MLFFALALHMITAPSQCERCGKVYRSKHCPRCGDIRTRPGPGRARERTDISSGQVDQGGQLPNDINSASMFLQLQKEPISFDVATNRYF